jgi:hypothetical protein
MKNFAKGAAFVLFGVICSPMLLGMFAPLVAWKMTESVFGVVVVTVVSFSSWAVAYEWMTNRKWHYNV